MTLLAGMHDDMDSHHNPTYSCVMRCVLVIQCCCALPSVSYCLHVEALGRRYAFARGQYEALLC